MAVKTKFNKTDITNILSEYNLGDFVSLEPIKNGTVQTNILLKTSKGKFVFRYYECRLKNSVLFEVNLIKYLKDKNYPCPAPFRNIHGNFVGMKNNKPFVIFEFIEGKHIEKPNDTQRKQLIQKVAELQNITKNYNPFYKKYRWNYSIDLCKKLATDEAKKIGSKNAKDKLKWLKNELVKLKLPKTLPKGICHCDFHFSNVLFKNGKFNALIDFDDANYTFLSWDLICLTEPFKPAFDWNTWQKFCPSDNVFDFKQIKKIVSEYMKYRPLNKTEKKYLFDVYKLSLLMDCIWYFKRGKANDFFEKRKIDYLNNLGRDNFYKEVFE
jgi:homoserine kinase type II